jgi:hypothetical protein
LTSLNADRTSILLRAFVSGGKGDSLLISLMFFQCCLEEKLEALVWPFQCLPWIDYVESSSDRFAVGSCKPKDLCFILLLAVPTPRQVASQEHVLPQFPTFPWLQGPRLQITLNFGAQISALKLANGYLSGLPAVATSQYCNIVFGLCTQVVALKCS